MSTPDAKREVPDRPGWPRRALRLLTSPSALLQATGFLVLVAIGIGSGWLLPPPTSVGDLPGDDAVGTLATVTIKANRDYTIPDPDATEALREQAAEQVRSVYDFDIGAGDEIRARLAGAFSLAREALAVALAAPTSHRSHPRTPEETGAEAVAAARLFYGDFIKQLQTIVPEGEYQKLARVQFSQAVQDAATELATAVLTGEVAPSRELLLAQHGHGITLRRVGTPTARGERDARDVDHIPDVAGVKEDLVRLADGLDEVPGSNSGVMHAATTLPGDLSPEVRSAAALLAADVMTANITYNAEETMARREAAREAVKPVVLQYLRGEQIVGEGERIEARHLLVFHFMRDQARAMDIVQIRTGAVIFTILLVVAAFSLARRTVRRFNPTKRDLVFLAATLLGNLAAMRAGLDGLEQLRYRPAWLTNELAWLVLPLAGGAMLVRMLRSGESAVLYALVVAPLTALQLNSHIPAAVGLISSLVAANRLGGRGGRSALPAAAVEAGMAAAASTVALAFFSGHLLPEVLRLGIAALVGGAVVSPLLALLVAPLFELLFGYVSESRLASLANLNHPVLKELIIRAPGTYHHSLIVGSLAEAGARSIGAHPLLARVGGYYHDLGKAEAALMFGENQRSENRLERLPPEEAAAVIHRHVADGVARAQRAHLPRVLIDFIVQHHGTGEAGDFYQQAARVAELEGRSPPDVRAFRYRGPRPRSREIALVMLADAIESASRSLADPTDERLRALVPQVVQEIVRKGQLDESDLTMSDIQLAIRAFQEMLVDVHSLSRIDVLPGVRPPGLTPAMAPVAEAPVRALR